MTDVVDLVKKLDFVTRKTVASLRDAKANAVAAEHIIEQPKDRNVVWQLGSAELATLVEAATTVSRVLESFDSVIG